MLTDCSTVEFEIPSDVAQFTAAAATSPEHRVQTDLATVKERHAVHIRDNQLVNWTLAQDREWSFGRFIPGDNQRPKIVNVKGFIEVYAGVNQPIQLRAMIGRLTVATPTVDFTGQVNLTDNAVPLPLTWYNGDLAFKSASVDCTVVEGTFDTSDGENGIFETNPLAIFWAIENRDATVALIHLRASLSIYSYEGRLGAINTVDPGR